MDAMEGKKNYHFPPFILFLVVGPENASHCTPRVGEVERGGGGRRWWREKQNDLLIGQSILNKSKRKGGQGWMEGRPRKGGRKGRKKGRMDKRKDITK
jgi:hypothetical protein